MSISTIEKIENLKTQIQQLENQKKLLLQKQKADERKARTHRLIKRGAILESLVPGADTFTGEQIKAFLEKTVTTENARKILDGFTAQYGSTVTEKSSWRVNNGGAATAEKAAVTEQGGG
ncbi:MAG: DUF3847 domain-containing protein [Oscillospiraceae bacterium]|nr:DUF3847 domain-containing protein [Oscillospiraceae bacterium]MDD4414713.1 DUF3847 domain-containing protein [Oscillospiraceae bacterium]